MGTPEVTDTSGSQAETLEELKKQADIAEKRRKDTQAEYTRNRQELLRVKAELEAIKKAPNLSLSQEDEELKFSDPDAWLSKIEALKAKEEEQRNHLTEEARRRVELEARQEVLRSFVNSNPDFDITSKEVQDQIPPVYIKQLENGDISFEDFLNKAKAFVEAPKQIVTSKKAEGSVDITKLAGGQKPTETKPSVVDTYSNITF